MGFKPPIISFLLMLFTVLQLEAQQYTVASYNVRLAVSSDTGNLWVNRAPVVAELIRFHDFDIFGTQEGLPNQIADMEKALPEYQRYGAGRDDGKEKGEHAAIFFKKEKFKLLDKGDFWLSETPEKPGLGWDAKCCNRICSWVYLQDIKTKNKFYFFNTHYDHQGVTARKESSKLILKKIKETAKNTPVILTGDFNGGQQSEWYKTLADSEILADTYKLAPHPYSLNGSFNGFGRSRQTKEIIDHIFVTRHFSVSKWGILTDTYFGKFPSDHFPVMAVVKLK